MATKKTAAKKAEKKEPEATAEPVESKDTVAVPSEALQSILKKQDELEESVKSLQKENEGLRYAADAGRLSKFEESKKEALIPQVTIGLWEHEVSDDEFEDRIIREWRMIRDDTRIEKDTDHSRQYLELSLDDGVKKDGEDNPFIKVKVHHTNFYRQVKRQDFDVVDRRVGPDGDEIRKIRLDSGREIEFRSAFINV